MVLGPAGYTQYHEVRINAIRELRSGPRSKRASNPICDDAFHDGVQVLKAVTDRHEYLRTTLRRIKSPDIITSRVLDLVDEHMLTTAPARRMTFKLMPNVLAKLVAQARVTNASEHAKSISHGLQGNTQSQDSVTYMQATRDGNRHKRDLADLNYLDTTSPLMADCDPNLASMSQTSTHTADIDFNSPINTDHTVSHEPSLNANVSIRNFQKSDGSASTTILTPSPGQGAAQPTGATFTD